VIRPLLLVALFVSLSPVSVTASPDEGYEDRSGCFTYKDLFICANNIKSGIYTVSALNVTKSPYPATMLVNCNGKPEADAFGTFPPVVPSDFLERFCAHVEGVPYIPESQQMV